MDFLVAGIIVLGYLSLLIELTFLHVPSVASNRSIWIAEKEILDNYSAPYKKLFGFSKKIKLLLFFLPLVGVYVVFLIPILYLLGVKAVLTSNLFQPSVLTSVIGSFVLLLGRAVTLYSVVSLRRNNTQQDQNFYLHTDSLFSSSRNPGLLGMYLFMFGIWICIPSVWLLLGIIYYIGYMHVKVRMEEDFLANKFGNTYQHYLNKTGRYWS